MTVVVTGGAGFIGSNFIFHMMSAHPDYRIVCVDKLTYAGNLETLSPLSDEERFRFKRVDICDRDAVCGVFEDERPDAVVNFAAESHVDRSITDPDAFVRTNVNGTAVLLDACRRFGGVRFHQISTDEVYGDLPLDRPDLFFTESSLLRPSSPYSASKAAADMLALSYCRTYGLHVTVSRCSNNYGRYQHPEKLIPMTVSRCILKRPIPVYGDGQNVRDWINVADHCRAVDVILHRGAPGEIYNVGGNCEVRNLDLVKLICRCLDCSDDLIEFVADRKGHDRRYAICADKLRCELGFSPEVPFEDGIRETVGWYAGHREWWERSVL